ncbi:ion channel [Haloarcula quadrata]|jgi:voltage-gated potassium channel Kch|uniref:Ion channel n=1 Tax=Haloarcula quadrata TaxID=182779 RepID=A0A495QQC6_9EURY|nr:ion channel [Haloarcula quadrata]
MWAFLFVFGYATAYDRYDLIVTQNGAPVNSFVDALYFSTLTFTTLGLGDFKPDPTVQLARVLVTSQAALGAILIAIFVFVLGRRAAR